MNQNHDTMKTKALVLLSGGQDSTTCLYWAIEHFDEVHAIGFDYGQSHAVELQYAADNAKRAEVPFAVVDVKGLLATSSLIEHGDHNESSYLSDDLPASFTPGRNLLFLTVAASKAAEMGITDLVTGVCQTDYSGYPDCRRNTIDALQLALSLGVGNGDMRIHTPLMYLNKAETWKMAADLGVLDVIRLNTMTDYDGNQDQLNEWGYGSEENPASKLRAEGYRTAKEMGWV